jgi:hypothetical protein
VAKVNCNSSGPGSQCTVLGGGGGTSGLVLLLQFTDDKICVSILVVRHIPTNTDSLHLLKEQPGELLMAGFGFTVLTVELLTAGFGFAARWIIDGWVRLRTVCGILDGRVRLCCQGNYWWVGSALMYCLWNSWRQCSALLPEELLVAGFGFTGRGIIYAWVRLYCWGNYSGVGCTAIGGIIDCLRSALWLSGSQVLMVGFG